MTPPQNLADSQTAPKVRPTAAPLEIASSQRNDDLALAPLHGPPEPEPGALLSACGHALRRRWFAGLFLGVVFASLASVAIWKLQEPQHTASVLLRIAARDVPLLFETADRSSAGRSDFRTYKNTQRQLLLSPFVLNNALRDEETAQLPVVSEQPDPVAWLQKELQVTFPDDAEIMVVSLATSDPAAAEKLVVSVVRSYLDEVVNAEHSDRLERLNNLQRVHAQADSKARLKRTELRGLAETFGNDTESLSLAQQNTVQQYGLMRNELTRVQFQLMRAEGEFRLYQQAEPEALAGDSAEPASPATDYVSELELERRLQADREAAQALADVEWAEQAIAETERRLTAAAAAPRLGKFRADLDDAQRRLAARRELLRDELVRQNTRAPERRGRNSNLAMEVAILKEQEKKLQEEVTLLQEEAKKFGRSSIDVEMIREEIDGLDDVVRQIGGEIERTQIELTSESRITLLAKTEEPASDARALGRPPVETRNVQAHVVAADPKKRILRSALGGVFGLFLPFSLLIWRDASKRHIDGVGTVTSRLGLDVLGILPNVPARMRRSSRRARRWHERLSESVAAVAAMLLQKAALEDRRVILVSSAVAGEGKTTLAGHLATALAGCGRRTLLIDFDLRRPTLGRVFGLQLEPGVSEVLQRSADLTAAIQPTEISNLFFLAAGRRHDNLLATAARGTMKELFHQLRAEFDFVVVDGSPILPVVDARLLGQYTDGVVLSLLRDVSRVPKVTSACDLLDSYGIPVIGTVVLGCSEDVYYASDEHQSVA